MKAQNKRGFTIVELVVVIAIVAVLAAVLIPTFSTLIKKANESAYLQEKTNQKIDDMAEKVTNDNWLGWEDFEAKIVKDITKAIADDEKPVEVTLDSEAIKLAVKESIATYYAENAMQNTGLTEEQVKKIVENALKGSYAGITEAQVTAIVETAVSGLANSIDNLDANKITAAQIQEIVNSAIAKANMNNLTSAQVSEIVAKAVNSAKSELQTSISNGTQAIDTAISNAVNDIVTAINNASASSLTEAQVKEILNSIVLSQGTTTWITSETYASETTFTLKTPQDVVGLATLVNGGYDFAGKTIELPEEINLAGVNFTPIGNTRNNEFKGTISGVSAASPTVIKGLTLTEQFNAVKDGYLINCTSTGHMDKVGVGFVAYLGDDAVLENITFKDVAINITDETMDGISVGVAVGYLDGGTIRNVTVSGGSVTAVYRVGGLCGAAGYGTIENCTVENVTIESTGKDGKIYSEKDGWKTAPTKATTKKSSPSGYSGTYHDVGGLIGYLRQFDKDRLAAGKNTVTIIDTVISDVTCSSVSKATFEIANNAYKATATATGTVTGAQTTNNLVTSDTDYIINPTTQE